MRYALASAAGMPLLPTTEGQPEAGALPAPNEKVQALMTNWEQAVTEDGFLDAQHPKKLMPRMRHMFWRNGHSQDEVELMRCLCMDMIKTADKARINAIDRKSRQDSHTGRTDLYQSTERHGPH